VLSISAFTRDSTDVLVRRLRKLLASARLRQPVGPPAEAAVDLDADPDADVEVIAVADREWRISGARLEKAASMTNWDYAEAQDRFQRIMRALGVTDRLREAGVQNGDLIMVGNVDFSYFEETPMAARARLAGFNDEYDEDEEDAEEAAKLAREIDEELAKLLDSSGDIATF
jgi:GTP-binding protein